MLPFMRQIDVAVGRLLDFAEQRDRAHHLAGLAVAALRHVERDPGLLHRFRFTGPLEPSIVVTACRRTADTGSEQERRGWPSRCTVQAPHWAMPQPNLVPVSPICRARPTIAGCRGRHRPHRARPLTLS